MSNTFIKIPEGLYGRAYSLGGRAFINDISFWYALKAKSKDGFFRRGTYAQLSNKSENTIYAMLKRLAERDLISLGQGGFSLVSYDKLFRLLGYNMKVIKRHGKFHRLGTFKIWKLPASDVRDIVDFMMYFDIKLAIKRKLFATEEEQQKVYEKTIERGKLLLGADAMLDTMVIKQRASISGLAIAVMFGYRESSSGNKILHRLRKKGLLEVTSRSKVLDYNPVGIESRYRELKKKLGGKIQIRRGVITEVLPNGIRALD